MTFRHALVLLVTAVTVIASAQQTGGTAAGNPQQVTTPTNVAPAPKTRMLVELYPNEDIRNYNIAVQICEGQRRTVVGDLVDLQLVKELNLGQVGATGDALIAEVKKIKGVVGISIDKYSLDITINPAFLWDDIDPQIKTAFEKVLKVSLDVHIRGSADTGQPLTFEERESITTSSAIMNSLGAPVLAGAQTRAVTTSASKTTAVKKTTPVKKTTKKTSKKKHHVRHGH